MKRVLIIGLVILAFFLMVGGIFLLIKDSIPPPAASGSQAGPGARDIIISDYTFTPSQLIIGVGDTVVWTNNAPMGHTVTSDSGNELNSPTIASGSTYSHTFSFTGTYNYHCSIHPSMIGQIIVQ